MNQLTEADLDQFSRWLVRAVADHLRDKCNKQCHGCSLDWPLGRLGCHHEAAPPDFVDEDGEGFIGMDMRAADELSDPALLVQLISAAKGGAETK